MYRRYDPSQTLVDRLHRDDCRRQHAGMADHVGICKVDDREPRVLALESPNERIGDLASAHLWLVVVRGDVALGRHQLAPLPVVAALPATIEEVRDMCVLLGFGDMELALAGT